MRFWHIPKHIERINDELGELCERMARVETDNVWLKRLAVASLLGVITLLFEVLSKGWVSNGIQAIAP